MPRTRFERAGSWFVARCSIQLGYARVFGSSGWDRTSDDWLMRPGLLPLSYGTNVSWQTVMDSNHRMPQSKCGALPAWRTAYEVVAEGTGIEPVNPFRGHGLANQCIAALPTFLSSSRLRVPGVPNLCTRFPTAAACHCHGNSSDWYLAGNAVDLVAEARFELAIFGV